MRWRYDVDRLSALKGVQAAHARKTAKDCFDHAQASQHSAEQTRLSGEQAMQLAALAPELGLSRRALYERLRQLSVARSKLAEASLNASRLREQAAQQREEGERAHARSRLLRRKQRKLEHWAKQARRIEVSRQERRSQTQIQEEYACRPSRT